MYLGELELVRERLQFRRGGSRNLQRLVRLSSPSKGHLTAPAIPLDV
jgi:hypothetical protein